MEALNQDDDNLRLHFAAKSLRKILSKENRTAELSSKNNLNDRRAGELISELTKTYARELGRRLVHLLEFKHMEEMVTEVLWSFVNILAVKSDQFALHSVQSGAVTALSRILDPKLSTSVSKQHTLLSLTALSNMAAD